MPLKCHVSDVTGIRSKPCYRKRQYQTRRDSKESRKIIESSASLDVTFNASLQSGVPGRLFGNGILALGLRPDNFDGWFWLALRRWCVSNLLFFVAVSRAVVGDEEPRVLGPGAAQPREGRQARAKAGVAVGTVWRHGLPGKPLSKMFKGETDVDCAHREK
jgi:hypothetical protein